MSTLGNIRIGSKAPDFRCDAVHKGMIEEVTLSTYINEKKSWLILLFIPAAFSFVCPTEVLAFQNCLEDFKNRNCDVLFISVETKHSLWHWQNVPRQYGRLGQIDTALLSDANHKMSRDYGVLIEDEGVCLRGMFILDEEAVVQQPTKHGVLCPIDWKPSNNATDTVSTISNNLTESCEDRLTNLQKEFGDTVITDLDAKHKRENEEKERAVMNLRQSSSATSTTTNTTTGSSTPSIHKISSSTDGSLPRAQPNDNETKVSPALTAKEEKDMNEDDTLPEGLTNDSLPSARASKSSTHSRWSFHSGHSSSAPSSSSVTPMPNRQELPQFPTQHSLTTTARHARGKCHPHTSKPPLPPSPHPPLTPSHLVALQKRNTYESRRSSQVILEFADPTSSPQASPNATPGQVLSPYPHKPSTLYLTALTHSPSPSSTQRPSVVSPGTPGGGSQTRLQATFEALKKMSAGLASPRIDFSPKKSGVKGGNVVGEKEEVEVQSPGYFDVVADGVEA